MAGRSRGRQFLLISGLWLLLDQLTKQLIVHGFGQPGSRVITLLPGWLDLTYTLNSGAAFGMLRGQDWSRYLLAAVALGALGVMIGYRRAILDLPTIERVGLALVAAGAAGNLLDRLFRDGLVVDFIHFHIAAIGFEWPDFNVADIGVTCGMFLWVAHALYHEMTHKPASSIDSSDSSSVTPDGP